MTAMTPIAIQVHCPFCNAAQAVRDGGSYSCEFCLQGFSVQQARNEEGRLTAEIEAWLQQRVGASGAGSSTIDASSRAYIFQNKMLPDIRRDVDRALEILGDHAQYPLVDDPIRARAESGDRPNPLLSLRKQILGFKGLRARLSSEQVTSFAMAPSDKAAIERMDQQISDALHFSNIIEASSTRSPEGYAAARRNLEQLAADAERSLSIGNQVEQGHYPFLSAQLERFRCLAEVCRVYESAASPNSISGSDAARQLEDLATRLRTVGAQIENSGYSPAEALPLLVGIQKETAGCEALARWLVAYDTMAGRSSVAFGTFAIEMSALMGGTSNESTSDWVEACAAVVRARRGEVISSAVEDFGWVDGWVEGARSKKLLGMFGAHEEVTQVEEFLLPVWVGDVAFSKSAGKVFKEGVEGTCVVLVDACGASAERVVILDEAHVQLRDALSDQKPLSGRPVALPRSTRTAAQAAMQSAIRMRPQILNPSIKVRGLAFLPGAVVRFSSKKGPRELTSCLGGSIPVDSKVPHQLEAANELKRRFG